MRLYYLYIVFHFFLFSLFACFEIQMQLLEEFFAMFREEFLFSKKLCQVTSRMCSVCVCINHKNLITYILCYNLITYTLQDPKGSMALS